MRRFETQGISILPACNPTKADALITIKSSYWNRLRLCTRFDGLRCILFCVHHSRQGPKCAESYFAHCCDGYFPGAVFFPEWLARLAGLAFVVANAFLIWNLAGAVRRYRQHALVIAELFVNKPKEYKPNKGPYV